MNFSDPIADLLTRIRNAQIAQHRTVSIPASKIKIMITHILKNEGFIQEYKCIRDSFQGFIKVTLKYDQNKKGIIRGLKRKSKPGLRLYIKHQDIPKVKNNFGISILSTSKGILTNHQAEKACVGGEYLCMIW